MCKHSLLWIGLEYSESPRIFKFVQKEAPKAIRHLRQKASACRGQVDGYTPNHVLRTQSSYFAVKNAQCHLRRDCWRKYAAKIWINARGEFPRRQQQMLTGGVVLDREMFSKLSSHRQPFRPLGEETAFYGATRSTQVRYHTE